MSPFRHSRSHCRQLPKAVVLMTAASQTGWFIARRGGRSGPADGLDLDRSPARQCNRAPSAPCQENRGDDDIGQEPAVIARRELQDDDDEDHQSGADGESLRGAPHRPPLLVGTEPRSRQSRGNQGAHDGNCDCGYVALHAIPADALGKFTARRKASVLEKPRRVGHPRTNIMRGGQATRRRSLDLCAGLSARVSESEGRTTQS
jgi:hypothetical protein